MKRPNWIVFEGIEGVGKSTQVSLFSEQLTAHKITHKVTREPGGTPMAEAIRSVLIKSYADPCEPKTEALLMYASRVQHVAHTIMPAVEAGMLVVCDRFHDASLAYQGAGRQLGVERMRELDQWAIPGVRPDLVILLDAPLDIALGRMRKRGKTDRIEEESDDFFARIRQGYLDLAKADPDHYRIVDASGTVQEVALQIQEISQACGIMP